MKTSLLAKEIWHKSALQSHAYIKEEKRKHDLAMSVLKIGTFLLVAIGVFMQGGV